jgi:hypothetical protein
MADDVVVEQKTDVVEDKKPETVVTPEKKFTQAELDSTIQTRVRREKDAFNTAQTAWNEKEQGYIKQVEEYEKILSDFIKADMDGLTDLEVKAISRLSIKDQLELLGEAKKANKTSMPVTPKPKDQKTNVPGKLLNNFGGF